MVEVRLHAASDELHKLRLGLTLAEEKRTELQQQRSSETPMPEVCVGPGARHKCSMYIHNVFHNSPSRISSSMRRALITLSLIVAAAALSLTVINELRSPPKIIPVNFERPIFDGPPPPWKPDNINLYPRYDWQYDSEILVYPPGSHR